MVYADGKTSNHATSSSCIATLLNPAPRSKIMRSLLPEFTVGDAEMPESETQRTQNQPSVDGKI